MVKRKSSWGFPRWGEYGKETSAANVRICDFTDCSEKADHPAPKAPFSEEKWWFCQDHAAEYNRNWDFFQGMSDAEAKKYAKEDHQKAAGYGQSSAYSWGGGTDDDGFTRTERDALDLLDLNGDEDWPQIKKQFRKMAKKYHPDHNKNDKEAEKKFQQINTAYEILRQKLEPKSYS